jgi:hypothetical protein
VYLAVKNEGEFLKSLNIRRAVRKLGSQNARKLGKSDSAQVRKVRLRASQESQTARKSGKSDSAQVRKVRQRKLGKSDSAQVRKVRQRAS